MTRTIIVVLTLSATCAWARLPESEHISVSGEGKIKVEPELAEIDVSIAKTDSDLAAAKKDVDERTSRLLRAARQLGVKDKDITSTQLAIRPKYDWHEGERRFLGNRVSREVTLTLRDLKQFRDLIQSLVDAGITEINHTEMLCNDMEKLRMEATEKAVSAATEKARILAKQFGAELGPIYSIHETPHEMVWKAGFAASMEAEVFVPGTITVEQSIYAVFRLKVRD